VTVGDAVGPVRRAMVFKMEDGRFVVASAGGRRARVLIEETP
jgi:hypothetical protein